MGKTYVYEIDYQEYGKEPSSTGYVGKALANEVVKFFGLREPDIKWYKIRVVKVLED